MDDARIPVVVIVGATASGKTSLAVSLARSLGGEVVSADAMAVYRDMTIGTAKPRPEERAGIPHHCIDCIDPSDHVDVTRWLTMAETAIADIHARGKPIIVAGGSPLYIKAMLEGLSAGPPRDDELREHLHQRYLSEGGEALLKELQRIDPDYAQERHANDERRIVRALEVYHLTGKPYSSFHVTDGIRRQDYRSLLIGIRWDKDELHRRINMRAKAMFSEGLVDEVRALRHRLSHEAVQAVGYKEVVGYLEGGYDLEHARYLVQRATRRLAKMQMTWLRRFTDIHWLPGHAANLDEQALQLAQDFLAGKTLGEPSDTTGPERPL